MPMRAQPHQTSASCATPGDRHRPDLPEADVAVGPPADQQEGDHHHVHQDRRRRGQREAAERVQHAGEQRRQRDEEDVGKGDAPVLDREREALVAGEAARHRQHQPGHGELAEQGEDDEHGGEAGERVAGEALGVLARLELLGEHRHEGEVEGALGEEAAEHVGQREGDQERLRHRAGAEEGRHQDVAQEPEDPAQHRPGADAEERRQQADRTVQRRSPSTVRDRRLEPGLERAPLALGVQLQPEQVLDVEDVDRLLAVGGDDRRGDRDVVGGQRAGEVVEQARPVAGLDLDDRVDVRAGVVEADPGRHHEVALAPLDPVLVLQRLAGDDLAA